MVLSVITVVYNNASDLERTIRSVLNQTYPHIEYIIIDGGSTDGTLDILDRYADQINTMVSEADEGIYDAMNKGLRLATGDYVLFMNSGDEIYNSKTVEMVFKSSPDADIYYGETELYNENWEPIGMRRHRTPAEFTWKSFKYGMNISHQAIYVRRAIAPFYDMQYKLSADVDWVIKAAKNATKITNTRLVVAKYLVGGLSKKRHSESLKERYAILSKHYGRFNNAFNHGIIALKYLRYRLVNGRPWD